MINKMMYTLMHKRIHNLKDKIRGTINRARLNYFIDVLMGLSFLITAITGMVLFIFMPSGIRQGRHIVFLGMEKSKWIFLHDWSGILMIITVMIHFMLHWNWMICMTRCIFKKKVNCEEQEKNTKKQKKQKSRKQISEQQ